MKDAVLEERNEFTVEMVVIRWKVGFHPFNFDFFLFVHQLEM